MGNRNKITSSCRRLQLSERDSLRVLNLLEKPPAPNAKLVAASRVHCLSGSPSEIRNPVS